jgi:uncharacterized protein
MSNSEPSESILGRVSQLWRYPVKSMLGESCDELTFGNRGVHGDRFYAVRRHDGKLGSGKDSDRFCEMLGLFDFQAILQDGEPLVTFPDGTQRSANDPTIHAELSRVLGVDVTLSPEADVAHMDAGSVHLITSAGLQWLSNEAGGSECDPRRFRANLLIELDAEGPVELDWMGEELQFGSDLRLDICQATGRCVMTTFAQDDLPQNTKPLQAINRVTHGQFGVYGIVNAVGTVRVGDLVFLR